MANEEVREMGRTFTLRVACNNAAFDNDPSEELARILRAVADRFETESYHALRKVYDVSGNEVGQYTLKGEAY